MKRDEYDQPSRHRVLIIGGGFGGLYCARALRRSPVDVTLIDRHKFHLFQPLLYQVATGPLSAANIQELASQARSPEEGENLLKSTTEQQPGARQEKP
jgi:NADH dehydrogenase